MSLFCAICLFFFAQFYNEVGEFFRNETKSSRRRGSVHVWNFSFSPSCVKSNDMYYGT